MENASKALLIAAGILIAIIILGAFIYLFGEMARYSDTQATEEQMEQINQFNKEYEAYQRNWLRGIEIASVTNKAQSYNIASQRKETGEEIRIYMTLTLNSWESYQANRQYDITNVNFESMKNNQKDSFDVFKQKYFRCDRITYDENTGKVNALYFTEVDGLGILYGD